MILCCLCAYPGVVTSETCEAGGEYSLLSTRDSSGTCKCSLSNEEREYETGEGEPELPVQPLPTIPPARRGELLGRLHDMEVDLFMLEESLYWIRSRHGYDGDIPGEGGEIYTSDEGFSKLNYNSCNFNVLSFNQPRVY